MTLRITGVRLTPAHAGATADGLLGFVTLVIDDRLRLDGLTLRRTRAGKLAISFPERTDGKGRRHPVAHPIDDAARREIEGAVLAALGLDVAARERRP